MALGATPPAPVDEQQPVDEAKTPAPTHPLPLPGRARRQLPLDLAEALRHQVLEGALPLLRFHEGGHCILEPQCQ
ncbi:hypothetical protein RHS01_02515 [Rhizoctonia solani]|uniref:Uncharacterized protein n=1 Tax=Rhizoctonia solani TaxID=456999 RepID=A0A8H7IJF4_9AGAM|nr:hypothetical protein RHS01_02515 [Rhizoctonia solani]